MDDAEKIFVSVKSNEAFEPLVVMELAANTKQDAIEWVISKLEASCSNNVSELSVSPMVMRHNQLAVVGCASCNIRICMAVPICKCMHEFAVHSDTTERKVDGKLFGVDESRDDFLTMAEKQTIIFRELENIRATEADEHVPGYEFIKLYPGRTIVKKLVSQKFIKNLFPLHDQEFLKKLGAEWYKKPFADQPIDKIHHYFGDKITMYFAFLGFYTVALIPPAVIGILYWITSWQNLYREAIFAVFNLVWATLFLEAWKRYCSELAFKWGSLDFVSTRFEEPRANYFGRMGQNPVTSKPEPVFPKSQRLFRFYGVTVPVLFLCLAVAFYIMLGYFGLQAIVDQWYREEKQWYYRLSTFMPTVIYAIAIAILNTIYRKIATRLNEFENHRLQTSYDNHMILKLILFEFVNCFMSLFYVAFYLQDMRLLRSHLACLLITTQIVGQIQESIIPFLFHRQRANKLDLAMKKFDTLQKVELHNAEVAEEIQKQAIVESTMDVYEGTLNDYLEMFLQFGYVFLFSSVFPLAAVWALLNNVTEIRSDGFKMCRVFQRPFAVSASNIGAWQVAFEVISVLAVVTNCALIGMNPEISKLLPSNLTSVNVVLIFVVIEHILIAVKIAVAYFIPDVPKWVEVELAKIAYQSKLALQKQQIARAHAAMKAQ